MKLPILVAVATVLSACVAEPPDASQIAVADPNAAVPPLLYVPVLAGTVDHRPVTPRPWGEVNDTVAPEDGE
jgi:hypothetical protein